MLRRLEQSELELSKSCNGAVNHGEGLESASPNAARMSVRKLEERFSCLSQLMYTTRVPLSTLEDEVIPYLAPDIQFVDPWVRVRGAARYRTGLRGFHCIIHFDFDVFQLNVQLNERRDGGRVIVDGVMNLRQLRFYTYPLRTILVYDFVMTDEGRSFLITNHEEMWSFGDMIQNAPLIGWCYGRFRRVAGKVIESMFWLACEIKTKLA